MVGEPRSVTRPDVILTTEGINTSNSAVEPPATSQDLQHLAWKEVSKQLEEDIERKSRKSSNQLVMSCLSSSEISLDRGPQDPLQNVKEIHHG